MPSIKKKGIPERIDITDERIPIKTRKRVYLLWHIKRGTPVEEAEKFCKRKFRREEKRRQRG